MWFTDHPYKGSFLISYSYWQSRSMMNIANKCATCIRARVDKIHWDSMRDPKQCNQTKLDRIFQTIQLLKNHHLAILNCSSYVW